jgi:hypothetical protein
MLVVTSHGLALRKNPHIYARGSGYWKTLCQSHERVGTTSESFQRDGANGESNVSLKRDAWGSFKSSYPIQKIMLAWL